MRDTCCQLSSFPKKGKHTSIFLLICTFFCFIYGRQVTCTMSFAQSNPLLMFSWVLLFFLLISTITIYSKERHYLSPINRFGLILFMTLIIKTRYISPGGGANRGVFHKELYPYLSKEMQVSRKSQKNSELLGRRERCGLNPAPPVYQFQEQ